MRGERSPAGVGRAVAAGGVGRLGSSTSSPAPATAPSSSAASSAVVSTSPPRAVLTSTARACTRPAGLVDEEPGLRVRAGAGRSRRWSRPARPATPGDRAAGLRPALDDVHADDVHAERRRPPASDCPIAPQPTTPKRSSDSRRSGLATRYSQLPRPHGRRQLRDPAQQRQRQRDGVVGDLLGAVVRHVGHPDAAVGRPARRRCRRRRRSGRRAGRREARRAPRR